MGAAIVFWAFQVINGLSSLAMFLAPKKFHESLFKDPGRVYGEIGFSPTAVEMVHNVIRGQGAALLTITIFLFVLGPGARESFLLIAIGCGLTLLSHVGTYVHHKNSAVVMKAIGSLSSLIPLLVINFAFVVASLLVYLTLGR